MLRNYAWQLSQLTLNCNKLLWIQFPFLHTESTGYGYSTLGSVQWLGIANTLGKQHLLVASRPFCGSSLIGVCLSRSIALSVSLQGHWIMKYYDVIICLWLERHTTDVASNSHKFNLSSATQSLLSNNLYLQSVNPTPLLFVSCFDKWFSSCLGYWTDT